MKAAHRLHIDGGVSLSELARRGWKVWGYSSADSAAHSLRHAFIQLGLERREAGDAVRLRHSQRGSKAKQRFALKQCKGTTKNGRACKKYAPPDSDYCWSHDPENRERQLEIGREHLPKSWAMNKRELSTA